MLRLCIDTSYKYLSVCLIEDHKIIGAFDGECFKRQSEEVFVRLDELFKSAKKKPLDIDSLAISIGPGSYTGVRIALTIAKVICEIGHIDLYKISTLKLYSNNNENVMVILNARSQRAYVGIYDKGKAILEDTILEVKDIDIKDYEIVGDGSLVNLEDKMYKVSECFLNNLDNMEKVEDINHLIPIYLKESDSYLK